MLDVNRVIAAGDSGVFMRSTDGGLTWAQQAIGTSNALYSIGSIDVNKSAIVGEGGTILGPAPGIVTSVQKDIHHQAIPSQMVLEQNYPNPFNPTTHFEFRIADFGFVSLKIFDLLGREVATLVDGRMEAGTHTVVWNALGFSSGVYFYRLQSGNSVLTRKLILLK
jgi:hypothetical protein